MLDQCLALTPRRRADFDFALALGCKRFCKQSAFIEVVRNEHKPRRWLVVVELRKKGAENFVRPDRAVSFRKISTIAPVLPSTEEEYLYARKAAGLVHSEYIGLLYAARINPLDRKSTRLNSSHLGISYAVFCLKKK